MAVGMQVDTPGVYADRRHSQPDIAILLPTLEVGGAELSLMRLAAGFAARGRLVDVLTLRHEGPLAAMLSDGVRGVPLGGGSTMRALPALVRYLRSARPDVLLSGQPHLNLAAVVAGRVSRAAPRIVLTDHAPPSLEIGFYGGWRYKVLRVLVPLVYRHADRIVGVSDGVCRELRRLLPGRAIELAHNPVVPDELPALAGKPASHLWLSDGGPPMVLSAGRLAPEKDFPTLVKAIAVVARHRPVRLMILGAGPDRDRIRAVADARGISSLLALPGRVENVFPFLSRAAVFALASLFEGFGNVLVEALACGLPVVSTDCPVGPREILGDGRFGCLVPPGDVAALARGIEAALDGSRPPPGQPQHIASFTVNASVTRCLGIIDEMLAEQTIRSRARASA
jgi:glycosyltransferase involved in cell wall biosynthesis